ncbi:septation protein SepH [Nocardiopsis lambiniae]|uniref:Septation protein SepH n=1 Tax=Nocardiopsis lambiniae TaxID=3075539 RepID=A0ABU2MAC4_9ACTN|nr:septation protein SepH [Nocardiopsis sp. DSM 44743]MDT0329626.1 septation protein SepH [Nocardiopsis sp. DSM 44743]
MHELRLVAVSEDGTYLVLASTGRGTRFMLPVDDRLRAAVRGQFSRLGQYEIEVENPLRPKEIQARIRSGETAEAISEISGIPLERVRWFEGPVLQEREYIAQQAQRAGVRIAGETAPGGTLEELVTRRIGAHQLETGDAVWDSWKREDRSWQLKLVFLDDGEERVAHWLYEPRHNTVSPADEEAARFSSSGPPKTPSTTANVTPFAPRRTDFEPSRAAMRPAPERVGGALRRHGAPPDDPLRPSSAREESDRAAQRPERREEHDRWRAEEQRERPEYRERREYEAPRARPEPAAHDGYREEERREEERFFEERGHRAAYRPERDESRERRHEEPEDRAGHPAPVEEPVRPAAPVFEEPAADGRHDGPAPDPIERQGEPQAERPRAEPRQPEQAPAERPERRTVERSDPRERPSWPAAGGTEQAPPAAPLAQPAPRRRRATIDLNDTGTPRRAADQPPAASPAPIPAAASGGDRPAPKRKGRGRRASVPSWDEIMFGAKKDE